MKARRWTPAQLALPCSLDTVMDLNLRQLLRRFQPAPWPQGQPATALAHTIPVALNALQERMQEEKA